MTDFFFFFFICGFQRICPFFFHLPAPLLPPQPKDSPADSSPLDLLFLYNFDRVIPPGVKTPFGPSPLWYRSSFLKGPPGSQQSPHAQPPPHNPSNPMMGPHGQVRHKHLLSNTPLSFIPSKSPSPPHTHKLSFFLSLFLSPFLPFTTRTLSSSTPRALLVLVSFWLTPRRCYPLQLPAPLWKPWIQRQQALVLFKAQNRLSLCGMNNSLLAPPPEQLVGGCTLICSSALNTHTCTNTHTSPLPSAFLF